MGYDTSILNFVTLGLKFCFANSFDSCRMGGLALFTIQVFSKIFSGIFVQKGSLLKRSFILNSKEFFFFSTTSYHADFNCPKGQLISKCSFGVLKSTKKTNEIFVRISALASTVYKEVKS